MHWQTRFALAVAAILICGVPPATAQSQSPAQLRAQALTQTQPQEPLARFAWLQGAWLRTDLPDGESGHETWTRQSDGRYAGIGVHQRANGARFEEQLQITTRGDDVVYIAQTPQNDARVAFALTASDADHAVFENPSHDFPTRIAYQRLSPDGLVVRIDGDGRSAEFRFRRAASALQPESRLVAPSSPPGSVDGRRPASPDIQPGKQSQ